MTPERKVKDKVAKTLKTLGVYFFYPSTHGYGRSGVPDIICCVAGRFLAIECKAGKNKPTALQEKEMAAILEAGGSVIVVNEENVGEVANVVTALAAKPPKGAKAFNEADKAMREAIDVQREDYRKLVENARVSLSPVSATGCIAEGE